jgi:hypothetical protein
MTPLIFSQPQVPPSKEFARKTQGPLPTPGFPTTVHLWPGIAWDFFMVQTHKTNIT